MQTTTEEEAEVATRDLAKSWGLFLAAGICWVLVAFAILSADPGTGALIGYMAGFVLIAGGVNELVTIGFTDTWKWVHGVLGALFIVAGIMALMAPFQTFGILALLIGWYLLFKGTASIVLSIAARDQLPLWGLMLASGIIEVLIGIWAIGAPVRSAWLLVLWIGIGALMRGMTEIVMAFKLRSVKRAVA